MRDKLKQELNVHDVVVTNDPYYKDITLGEIIKITNQKIRLQINGREYVKDPSTVIKISSNLDVIVTMYFLKK